MSEQEKNTAPEQKAAPALPKQPKIDNSALKKAATALREENNPKNFNAVVNLMMRSVFLAPAKIEIGEVAPKPDENGRIQLPKNTKVTFALLKSGEGKSFFTAFTDAEELNKWTNKPEGQVMLLRFDDYARMLNGNDHVDGFVLNPFSDNLRFNSDMVASLLKQRNEMMEKVKQAVAQQAAQRAAQIKPGDKVTIVEPSVYPDELVNPLCSTLEKYPMVGAAYLQIMVINGTVKSYLLVLDAPKDDAVFKAAGDAARPFLAGNDKKMNLNITISTSPLGQQGMRGSEPFYIKGQGRVDNLDDDED